MYSLMRKKAVYSPAAEGQANVGPTAPAGPVYEEVSPKEEIELNTNQAYGPVGLWKHFVLLTFHIYFCNHLTIAQIRNVHVYTSCY